MDSKEMFEVLQRVKTWKPEMRIDLARRVLETIVSPRPPLPPQTMTLEEVQAIMKQINRRLLTKSAKKSLKRSG